MVYYPYSFGFFGLLFLLWLHLSLNHAETNLSEEHHLAGGVWFDPSWVSEKDIDNKNDTTEHELMALLTRMSAKFTKIIILMMQPISSSHKPSKRDLLKIPTAVAKVNRDRVRGGAGERPPLELIIQVEVTLATDNKNSSSELNYFFQLVKGVADEANSIYPNTVKTIVLVVPELLDGGGVIEAEEAAVVIQEVKEQATQLQLKLNSSTFSYKLGIGVDEAYCGRGANNSSMTKSLLPVFQLVDVVVFNVTANHSLQDGQNLQSYLQTKTIDVEKCMSKMKGIRPELEVDWLMWLRWWSSSSETGDQRLGHVGNISSDLVTFWKYWDSFGSRNTSFLVQEAFDNQEEEEEEEGKQHGKFIRDSKGGAETEEDIIIIPDRIGVDWKQVMIASSIGIGLMLVIVAALGISVYLLYRKMRRRRRRDDEIGRSDDPLTEEEIKEFFHGVSKSQFQNRPITTFGIGARPGVVEPPYDKGLEISKGEFKIDKQRVLGVGAYGSVFRGKLFKRTGEREQQQYKKEVAVKVTKRGCPATALKGVLSEIKVLSLIGTHPYIIALFGANTTELFKGKVCVFTELCELGSLDKFLQRLPRPGRISDQNPRDPYFQGTLLDLEKWSFQIAVGMEFLVSKHIVHADLATRNILLTEEKTVKISDFGLSRRLYDYQHYVSTSEEPLPWRWMSPESLSQMEFGEKSDVWAYGITLWEIFSLGELPYPEINWDFTFASRLDSGLRPENPICDVHNNKYYGIMMKCWDADPQARPSFSDLKVLLNQQEIRPDDGSECEYLEL